MHRQMRMAIYNFENIPPMTMQFAPFYLWLKKDYNGIYPQKPNFAV